MTITKKTSITVLTSLYNCIQYLPGYLKYVDAIDNKDDVEILLLHNAPKEEELELIEGFLPTHPYVKHVVIEKLEGLYTTWNRGILMAQGEFICVWNVDDIRLSNSLRIQAMALCDNPNAALAYGDYGFMYEYDVFSNDIVHEPEYNSNKINSFYRAHHIGCFPMWRKNIHEKIGYFDEQFRLVADFEFQMRVARNYPMIKAKGLLGYYLEFVSTKLSSNGKIQWKERNVLYFRFGLYDMINWVYLISTFRNYNILLDTKKHKFRGYKKFLWKRTPLLLGSIIHQPRNFASYIKHYVFNF